LWISVPDADEIHWLSTYRLYCLSHDDKKHGNGKNVFRHLAWGVGDEEGRERGEGGGGGVISFTYLILRWFHVTRLRFPQACQKFTELLAGPAKSEKMIHYPVQNYEKTS
jgi:hypothetical protein